MLATKYRLTKKRDIDKVFLKKQAVFGKSLIINFFKNNLSTSRFAISISKKYFKKAVVRNYYKRILRHIIYKNIKVIPVGYDFVLIVKKEILQNDFLSLEQEILTNIKKLENKHV